MSNPEVVTSQSKSKRISRLKNASIPIPLSEVPAALPPEEETVGIKESETNSDQQLIESLKAELTAIHQQSASFQQQALHYAQTNLVLEKQVGVLRAKLLKSVEESVDAEVRVELLNNQVEQLQKMQIPSTPPTY